MVLFIIRLTAVSTKATCCAVTHELMDFKFSYLRNWALLFDEAVTCYIKYMVIYAVKMVHVYTELCRI